jgi:hypothetical protein
MGEENIPVATKVILMGMEEKAGGCALSSDEQRIHATTLIAQGRAGLPVEGECQTQESGTE